MVQIINSLDKALDELASSNIVALPTETVYGLAADADNEKAIAKIFAAKNRPENHPLIVHVSDYNMAKKYVCGIPEYAIKLINHFWPGPLTLVCPKSEKTSDKITGGQDTVAIRAPAHPLTQEIITKLGRGIVAPSANKFGHVSPTTALHVADEFINDSPDGFHYILDGGSCNVGIESTIIDCTHPDSFKILRPGILTREQLETVARVNSNHSNNTEPKLTDNTPRVSGALHSHYSPHKPVVILSDDEIKNIKYNSSKKYMIICSELTAKNIENKLTQPNYSIHTYKNEINLSANIYNLLRIGENNFDTIIFESLPLSDKWEGLRDRLEKAAYNYKKPIL